MLNKKGYLNEIGALFGHCERWVCGMCLSHPFAACRKIEEWKTQEQYSLPPMES